MWRRRILFFLGGFVVFLVLIVCCMGFRRPTVPLHVDYKIAVESKLGVPIRTGDCLLIFEEEKKYYLFPVHGPETHWTGQRGVAQINQYQSPVSRPRFWEYGLLFGPHVRSDTYLHILVRGHVYRYVHVGHIAPDVTFQENPKPVMSTDEDLIVGATYYVTPLMSEIEFRANMDEIRNRFGVDTSSASRKAKNMVQVFLSTEEAEMQQILRANIPNGGKVVAGTQEMRSVPGNELE